MRCALLLWENQMQVRAAGLLHCSYQKTSRTLGIDLTKDNLSQRNSSFERRQTNHLNVIHFSVKPWVVHQHAMCGGFIVFAQAPRDSLS
jgi:hypothetical protein